MTESSWMWRAPGFRAEAFLEDIEADVCVVGAGVAGLTAAYRLAREGRAVVVLEAGEIGRGETSRSTAHLATAIGTRYEELETLHGADGARLVAQGYAEAIEFIAATGAQERITCGLRRLNGYLLWPADADPGELERELQACLRAGVDARRRAEAPLDFWSTGPCLEFPGQGQVDPLRYAEGLAAAAQGRGARIFSGCRASIESRSPLVVRAGSGTVRPRALILATNAPIDDRVSLSMKQGAYRTYVIAAPIPPEAFEPVLLWDTVDPYHYVRVVEGEDGAPSQLIVGGEDHKVGHAADPLERWQRLEVWARERFPMMGPVSDRWSGQVQESVDGLPYAGRHPTESDEIYVITGDSGDGMTGNTLGALVVADELLGRPNRWSALLSPARVNPAAVREALSENVDAASQYLRYVSADESPSAAALPPGSGAIVRRGLLPIAAYRGVDGRVTERSAICPHLGGVVCWNPAEGTWDCPVHGSRFAPDGTVVTGPANEPLGEPGTLPGLSGGAPRPSAPPPAPPAA